MNERKIERQGPLEEGLLRAMRALDMQIAREMQRTPAEEEELGVLKWEPYQKRIENVASFVMNSLGDQEVGLDSLLVLTQALSKSLQFVVADLGADGLGKVRTAYCQQALENISRDAREGSQLLKDARSLT
jgi:hypothetical protein